MIVIATALSWLLLQYQVSLASIQRDEWLEPWSNWVASAIAPTAGNRVATLLTLLVPVAALAIVLALFGNWLLGLVGFAINIVALLYACGRGDYEQSCQQAIFLAQAGTAEHDSPHPASSAERVRLNYAAYERWFPVLFWFLLLGAPGAVFYRLLACYAQPRGAVLDSEQGDSALIDEPTASSGSEISCDAASLLGWFDWLPARLWALACALAGNFSGAFLRLRDNFFALQSTSGLLDDVVVSAANIDAGTTNTEDQSDLFALAIGQCCELNRRVMVVALVLVFLAIIIF